MLKIVVCFVLCVAYVDAKFGGPEDEQGLWWKMLSFIVVFVYQSFAAKHILRCIN